MTNFSPPQTRHTSIRHVAPLLAAAALVACARSSFDPEEPGAGGNGGAAGTRTAGGTGGTTAGTGGTASGAGGTTPGTAGTGGSSGKGATGGTGGKGGGTTGGCRMVINEICAQDASGSGDPNDEFIELYNGGDAACNVEGWILQYRSDKNSGSGTPIWTGASGDDVAPAGFLLIASTSFKGKSDATYAGTLSKSGGGVGLKDASEKLIDSIAYGSADSGNDFCEGAPAADIAEGSSAARSPDGKDTNDNAADFSSGSPTPGATN